jgi:pimeloyl-ACP methyl ester carboxylesterase
VATRRPHGATGCASVSGDVARARADMRESSVLIDGVRSPLLEVGPADANEAVVFVHGSPGSTRDWGDLERRIGEFGRGVAMDMPGFGAADKPAQFDYSVAGYARYLGRLLVERGVQRAHLVMHDFGGSWGLAWAAANPQSIASVTCIDTGVLLGYHWHYLARIWQTPVLGEIFMATTTKPAMRLLLRHGNPRGLPPEYFEHVFHTFDQGTRRAVLKLYRNTRDTTDAMQQLADALRPLDLPALVVWGAHDPYVGVEFAEHQRQVFPHAEVKILPGSGHWPFADDPDAVAQVVVPFLRRQLQH